MAKKYLLALLLLSSSSFASDWQTTYFDLRNGHLFIDKESIIDSNGIKKFWTVYAPTVSRGQESAGYAYRKVLNQINCADRTAGTVKTIYYDVDQIPHDVATVDKSMRDIVPDSSEEYLWKYVCKPELQEHLAAPAGPKGIHQFLDDQAKFTRENEQLLKRMKGN